MASEELITLGFNKKQPVTNPVKKESPIQINNITTTKTTQEINNSRWRLMTFVV